MANQDGAASPQQWLAPPLRPPPSRPLPAVPRPNILAGAVKPQVVEHLCQLLLLQVAEVKKKHPGDYTRTPACRHPHTRMQTPAWT